MNEKNVKVMWFGREEELVYSPLKGIDINYEHKFLSVHKQGEWWYAVVDGDDCPWFRDSCPQAAEDTLEKAIAALEVSTKDAYDYVRGVVEGVGVA